ncbi:uncharacterized protein [Amphiura filiformis]|uniref:uncharacterized protein n=1 Tax=Amphiura filiformis TaxID=82378 RepID=UPI003B20C033
MCVVQKQENQTPHPGAQGIDVTQQQQIKWRPQFGAWGGICPPNVGFLPRFPLCQNKTITQNPLFWAQNAKQSASSPQKGSFVHLQPPRKRYPGVATEQGASATSMMPLRFASHQSQQSAPGYHMLPITSSQSRGVTSPRISNAEKKATTQVFLHSGYGADGLSLMEPRTSQGSQCNPESESKSQLYRFGYSQGAIVNSATHQTSQRYKMLRDNDCVEQAPTPDSKHSAGESDETLTEESLLQSLQPYKMRERGSLTNPFLERVARGIQPRWRELAARLGFSDDECEEFDSADNMPGPYWPAFRMLDHVRANFSETEAKNGKAILADAIQPLDASLYDKIVNWDRQ